MAATVVVLNIIIILIVQGTPLTSLTLSANRIVHVFRLENESDHQIQIWKNSANDVTDTTDHSILDVKVSGIYLKENIPPGTYSTSLDQDESESQPDMTNLTIHVHEINEKMIIFHSCRIRISDLTAERLLSLPPRATVSLNSTSLTYYDQLRQQLFELIHLEQPQLHPDCILLFAIKNEYHKRQIGNSVIQKFTIIRLAVRKSQNSNDFLTKEYVTGLLTLKKDKLSKLTGLDIESIGYNECMRENNVLCNDSCTSQIKISKSEFILHQGDTDSMATIQVHSEPKCICLADHKATTANCKSEPLICRNRGDCHDSIRGPLCTCYEPFDGPNCELQSIEFASSDLWMWLPPLQTCAKSMLHLEFSTKQSDCLLLYNGPMTQVDSQRIPDFVSLELRAGIPRFLIDTGTGPAELIVSVNETLNDGRLHSIYIYWINGNVSMVVDHCIAHNPCVNSATMAGLNRYLNVNMPLQLGKVRRMDNFTLNFGPNWPFPPPDFSKGFTGVIAKLKFNDFVYDMSQNPHQQELIADDKVNTIEDPDPVQESRALTSKIVLAVIAVLMLIVLLFIWRTLLRQKLAQIKKREEEKEHSRTDFSSGSLAKENITRIFVTNNEMKKAAESSLKKQTESKSSFGKSKVKKEPSVKYDGPPEKVAIASSLTLFNEQSLDSLKKVSQEVATINVAEPNVSPLDLTKRWSNIEKDPGPPDQTITYAVEGGSTPEPSFSTITAVGVCSQVDRSELVDDFMRKYVGYESAGSTIDGAEDYV